MKKRGFTLAEVLITLGIVGVIAALTAPGLVMNSRNEANAAKLAVSVSNLENALTSAIAQEGVDSLYRTQMWPSANLTVQSSENDIAKFVGGLGKYIHTNGFVVSQESGSNVATGEKYYGGNGPYAMNANGGTDNSKPEPATLGRTFAIELKNGAVLFMEVYANGDRSGDEARTQDQVAERGGSLWSNAINLFIDVNGKSSPNVFGRDIFHFYVGNNGILYPFGGMDVSVYETLGRDLVWNKQNDSTCCINGSIKNAGIGCTARLISEGYKMNY